MNTDTFVSFVSHFGTGPQCLAWETVIKSVCLNRQTFYLLTLIKVLNLRHITWWDSTISCSTTFVNMFRLFIISIILCFSTFSQGSVLPMRIPVRRDVNSVSSFDPVPTPLFLSSSSSIYCLAQGFDFSVGGKDCSLLRNYIHYIYQYMSNPVSSSSANTCTLIKIATINVKKACNESASNKIYPSADMDESCE